MNGADESGIAALHIASFCGFTSHRRELCQCADDPSPSRMKRLLKVGRMPSHDSLADG